MALSSSFPPSRRGGAIFLVFDDPKISSRSHGKIEISPLFPSPRHGKRFREPSFPLYLFYFALCLSTHPRFPLYPGTSIPSIPFERGGKKLDLRMNIPSAGEFITFIYPRVSNSYPCSSGRTDSPSNPPFSEFNLPDNETSRASSSPRGHLLKSPHPEASTSISLILDPFRSEGGRGKAAYGGGGVFGNPFAARYVAKSEDNGASERGAGEAGGNRRRVGWYKANRASQEDSFAPPFLPFASSSSSQFSTCSFHSTAGLPFKLLRAPGIVFSCLLILVLLFRVTLTTNLCSSVKILFASRPLSRPLSLSHLLFRPCEILRFQAPCQSHALDIGHSSRSSETRFFMHFIVH